MENNDKPNYGKIIDEELNKAETSEAQPSQTPPEPIKKEKISNSQKNKKPFIIILTIACLAIIGLMIALFIPQISTPPENNPKDPKAQDQTSYLFTMKDLGVKIELPKQFENKIFYESDGESYYIWGYTSDEKPEYITTEKNSPDFFPFFALNYSKDEFETDKYSFSAGDGAYGREDGRVLYLHNINPENILSLEDPDYLEKIAYRLENNEELTETEKSLVEKYKKIYEEINTLELYFKDGFKYQEL